MSLNHSKTWPVSTMAVVQLRVDPQGRAYSTLQAVEEQNKLQEASEAAVAAQEVIGQVLQERVRWGSQTCTQAASCTDTVSTVLEDFTDDCSQNQDRNAELRFCIQKFHVLALGRIDEESERCQRIQPPRQPRISPHCRIHGNGATTQQTDCNNRQCMLNDVPIDARKAATLYRHYYPEGGWGWVILICTVLVHVLTLGLQLSCSQFVTTANRKFQQTTVNTADVEEASIPSFEVSKGHRGCSIYDDYFKRTTGVGCTDRIHPHHQTRQRHEQSSTGNGSLEDVPFGPVGPP